MTNLLATSTNHSMKYKTEILQTQDRDYQYVSRSITNKNYNGNTTVLHMFRVNPVDSNEVRKPYCSLLDVLFYLHGVKANNIMDALTSGYPQSYETFSKQCKEECFGEIATHKMTINSKPEYKIF